MYQHRFSSSESPRVEVTACRGDLTVTTGDSSEILIEVDSQESLTVEERDDAVALVANSDCMLTVPANAYVVVVQSHGNFSVQGIGGTVEGATVQGDVDLKSGTGRAALGTVQGDLTAQGWRGPIDVGTVQGDAKVQQVSGPVDFGTVGGDLSGEEINGSLSVRSVTGDAYLRQLNGPLSLGDVGADLIGRTWTAGADVAQVGGDVSLKTVFAGPFSCSIQARGNIVGRVLPSSHATFTLQATKGRIHAKGLTGEMTGEGLWRGVIGDGGAQVTLTSTHSNIVLKTTDERDEDQADAVFTFAADFGQVGAEAGAAAQELAWRIQQRVAEKLAKIDFEAIARREAERARQQAEKETARAQRAAEKARRRAKRAQQKAQKSVRWRFEWDAEHGGQRATREGPATSEEERLSVLKMLAEGKISAEEAEILLQALEG